MSASVTTTATTDWSGGKSPFNVSYGKLMMWLFLLSDAFTFSGFLIAYGLVRFSANSWPVPEQVFDALPFLHGFHAPLVFVGIMTFILILSSVTMVLAVDAGHRMDKRGVQKWLFWTIIGGITFLSCQAFEWTHFIFGPDGVATLSSNPYGPPAFAAFFFFITGFHGTHVLSGVVLNYLVYYNTIRGVYEQRGHYDMVEKVGLYWHFVDLVWVFVFTFFYLV